MEKHTGIILHSPRITEKGAYLAEQGCYIFHVARGAGKKEIMDAIETAFKVVPRKIRTAAVPRKEVMTRGTYRRGKTGGGKKAYVYLKKGDTIELA